MSHVFDIQSMYTDWLEFLLAGLSLISLICSCRLTSILFLSRRVARAQAKFARTMDISFDNLLHNSSDYAFTEFVAFMSISDIFRAIVLCFRHLRLALNIYVICDSYSAILCLTENFLLWTFIANDIICYGVICFCLFRYLRKRSIFTQHSITPQRIQCVIICISIIQSTTQLLLTITIYNNLTSNYEVVYIPSLITLYSTVLYILFVFAYIRCCHPFWVIGETTKHRQFIFLAVFTVIFIAPLTLKMIEGIFLSPTHSSHSTVSLIADILLTQTGTGNFIAWYWSQRRQLLSLRRVTPILRMGSDSDADYVIVDDHKLENGTKRTVQERLFSSGGSEVSIPYQAPSIDVMAMEPMNITADIKRSNTSEYDIDESSNINHQLYIDSSQNVYDQPENMEQHIAKTYGSAHFLNDSLK